MIRFARLGARVRPSWEHPLAWIPSNAALARMAPLYGAIVVPLLLLVGLVECWPASDGRHDLSGSTFGHDFSMMWVVGRAALAGHAAAVYPPETLQHLLTTTFGPDAALFAWHYPPVFLPVAAMLATLPYAVAVPAWALASLLLVAGVLRAILGDARAMIVGLAFPLIAICLSYGQNGLLTASLLGLGLVFVDRRPWLAGICFGLVCYKPQLALVAPLLMLVTGRWRSVLGAALSTAGAVFASLLLFGLPAWQAFFASLPRTETIIFQQAWGTLALNASAFGAVRLLDGSMALAWSVQIAVAALAGCLTLAMWLTPCAQALRNAAVLATIPLVSPYVPEYDLAVLAPAAAFFIVAARQDGGLGAGERCAVLALYGLALYPRRATELTHCPVGFILACGVFALVVARAMPVLQRTNLSKLWWPHRRASRLATPMTDDGVDQPSGHRQSAMSAFP